MNRFFSGLCVLCLWLLSIPLANAATKPLVVVQTQSLDAWFDALLDIAGKIDQLAGNPPGQRIALQVEQVEQMLIGALGKDWGKIIDRTQPLAMFVSVDPVKAKQLLDLLPQPAAQRDPALANLWQSDAAFLLPIKNEAAFYKLLGGWLQLGEPDAAGVRQCQSPGLPFPLYVKVVEGYLFVSLQQNFLKSDRLPRPGDVVRADEKTAVSVRLHHGLLPQAELRKVWEEVERAAKKAAAENDRQQPKDETSEAITQRLLGTLREIVLEGEVLTVRLDYDRKQTEFALEWEIEPRPGTAYAKRLAATPPSSSRVSALATLDSVAHLRAYFTFSPEVAAAFRTAVQQAKLQEGLTPEQQALAKRGLALVQAWKEPLTLDLALALNPQKNGTYAIVFGAGLQNAKDFEQWIREAVKQNPPAAQAIRVDAVRLAKGTAHEIVLPNALPEPAQQLFGDARALVAFSKDAVYVVLSSSAVNDLNAAMKAQVVMNPATELSFSPMRLFQLLEKVGVPTLKELQVLKAIDRVTLFRFQDFSGKNVWMRFSMSGYVIIGAGVGFSKGFGFGVPEPLSAEEAKPKDKR